MIKLKQSSQLIGQFGHVTAFASYKQPEKHGMWAWCGGGGGGVSANMINKGARCPLQHLMPDV